MINKFEKELCVTLEEFAEMKKVLLKNSYITDVHCASDKNELLCYQGDKHVGTFNKMKNKLYYNCFVKLKCSY